jgi:hypothetical protein
VEYDSLDVNADGAQRWEQAGRPTVPSLVLGTQTIPLLHVSQLARALGLSQPSARGNALSAWSATGTLQLWLDRIRPLGWPTLRQPTQSRGRSIRNLTVNVFHPFELLPPAWDTGRFDWDPDRDDERERALKSAAAVVEYAEQIAQAWAEFVATHEDELERRDPQVQTLRGDLSYSELLEAQCAHADFHRRELDEFLAAQRAVAEQP